MLQLLGVPLAVAALGVAPSMATTNTSPDVNAAGGGGGGCDNDGPWSNWGHNWYGHDGDGRYWNGWGDGHGYFDGNADYGNCGSYGSGARSAAAGKVARVQVAVKRLRPSRCQHLTRAGHLSGHREVEVRHLPSPPVGSLSAPTARDRHQRPSRADPPLHLRIR